MHENNQSRENPDTVSMQSRQNDSHSNAIRTSSDDSSNSKDFTVIWRNLTFKINLKRWYHCCKFKCFRSSDQLDDETQTKSEKIIFNRISGRLKSRQLTAIMGPSGAGKSSLLHCLFQNRTEGVSGQILVDGKDKSKLKVCFIPQHDYLNEWLTVREDLLFVSRLKLSRGSESAMGYQFSMPGRNDPLNTLYTRQMVDGQFCSSLVDHEANVLNVTKLLGLNSCLDVPIKRISGGEKKRLSIARELMSKPDILVLDEPTTGLDSLTCYKTMVVLRDLVRNSPDPIIVIVTIHQPERAVFNMFDRAYVLSRGNGIIFDDSPLNAISTIQNVAQLKMPSKNYNPASFLIEISSDDSYSIARQKLSKYQTDLFNHIYDKSTLRKIVGPNVNANNWKFCAIDDVKSVVSESSLVDIDNRNIQKDRKDNSNFTSIHICPENKDYSKDQYFISHQLRDCSMSHAKGPIDSFWDTLILTHRFWLSLIRNPALTKSRLAFHLLLPLIMLAVFGNKTGSRNACPKVGESFKVSQMKKDIQDGVVSQNFDDYRSVCENISFFFILAYGLSVNIISTASSFYPLTLNMFKKETANGLYSAGPYFIGQLLAELPMELFFPTFSTLVAYQLTGQTSSFLEWRMFTVSFLVFIVSYFSQSLGYVSGLIFTDSVSAAVIFAQFLLIPFCITSGFVVSLPRMAHWLRQLSYLSIFRHFTSGFIATRYGFNVCDCDEESLEESSDSFMAPNLRHTLEYLFPPDNTTFGEGVTVTGLFDNLHDEFMKTQTFGMDIENCNDVRPYVMETLGVEDSDLFLSLIVSIVSTVLLRLVVFSLLKSSQFRKK